MKRKQIDLYLFNTDIEKLNARYSALYKQVKTDTFLTTQQMERECEILLAKYNFEIQELCKLREPEYWEQQAKIKAKNKEQTPWRRCWLWKLLFQPLTNRAQDIIELQAELDAEERFAPLEDELVKRAEKLFPANEKPQRWWQRLFHKKTKPADIQISTAVQETPESDSTPEPVAPEQPAEPSTAAPGANDAAHQSDDKAKEAAPAPPSEEPKKRRRRRNTNVPPAPALVPQLSGQINIEEI